MNPIEFQDQARLGKALFDYELNRFESQRQFGQILCDLNPAKAARWRALLEQGQAAVAKAAATGDASTLRETVRQAEALLAPLAGAAKSFTIHLAGHAHIDMNWMWSWPETVSVTVDTFITMLTLMEEFPEFTFSQSQASVYAILEQFRPDLLARVAKRVKEGRWEVTASHWVEGDKNLAGAESLCRHLLYTRRYMKSLLGLEPEDVPIDWSPDTFGHTASVPTYLAQGGVRFLYMHRPGDPECAPLWLFRWRGPDGSSVLVRNDTPSRGGYNGEVTGPNLVADAGSFFRQTKLRDHLFIYGVGDHGGGPTRRDLAHAAEMRHWPVFPTLAFGTVTGYMKTIEQQATRVPVIDRELNYEFAGCYTTQTLIKKANRLAENRLADAEMAASLAWGALDMPYPARQLEEGWRDTLFNHFHDILPGSGVHDTRTYTHGLFQKTAASAAQIETQALRALAARVDTASSAGDLKVASLPTSAICDGLGGGVGFQSGLGGPAGSEQSGGRGPRPFVVFNPLLHDRDEVIEATVWDNAPQAGESPVRRRSFAVRGPDGRLAPAQVVATGGFWRHDYATVAFRASVPGGGYALYTVVEADADDAPVLPKARRAVLTAPRHHCRYSSHERAPVGLENDLIRVDVNPVTGGILRLTDKKAGIDLITPEQAAPALEYNVERPRGMSAWLIQHPGGPAKAPVLFDLKAKQEGPLKASVEATLRIEQSDITLTYELHADDPRLHVKIAVVWFQRGSRETGVPYLTYALPLALTQAKGRYEIAFGAVDRALNQGQEVPALQWAQVTGLGPKGRAAGVLLLNDSKHGHSLDGNTLRLTLIRSSYDPDPLPEIGKHEINLALQPIPGDLPVPAAIRAGQAFNRALRVIGTGVHPGPWPAEAAWLRQLNPVVQSSGVKCSENGDGWVVRLFNPTARTETARLDVLPALARRVKEVALLDLMERPSAGKAAWRKDRAEVSVPAHGIVTLLLKIT